MRLFQFAGISVFVHWSWLLIAYYEYQMNFSGYTSPQWIVFETLAIFGIVLLHEFGHSFATRSVGGKSDAIVLWPLGGVAYVSPPQRPGAELWSIAAEPSVNVALIPLFWGLTAIASKVGWGDTAPNAYLFVHALRIINFGILVFNLIPIYPLDGGQILRSLLWFVFGKARSLFMATMIGFGGVALLVLGALVKHSMWMGIVAAFVCMNCWRGLKAAQAMSKIAKLPKHVGIACPKCNASPPMASLWICRQCQRACDPFAGNGTCSNCGFNFSILPCAECHEHIPLQQWFTRRPSTGSPPIINV